MTDFSASDLLAQLMRQRTAHHGDMLGIRFHAEGPDWAELALPYDPRFAADEATGILASGPIVTLMDMAAGLSVWIVRGTFAPQATLDFRVDYLRAAVPGHAVVGRGQCYRLTRRIAFVRGQAHDGDPDDPIAHVAGTFMLMDEAA